MQWILSMHSINRWLIVAVGLSALVRFSAAWLRNLNFSGLDRGLSSGFTGLIDLQVLLGVVFLFGTGLGGVGFPRYRIEHATLMIVALIFAHSAARWKNAGNKVRFRNTAVVILVTLALIYVGVSIVGGWG